MSKRSAVWQYIRSYRFNSIFFKNLLTLLVLEMIPVFVAFYLGYSSYSRLYESEVMRQHEAVLTEFITNADGAFVDTGWQSASLALSRDVELFLYTEPGQEVERSRVMNIQQLQNMQIMGTSYVKNAYILADKSQLVITHNAIVPLEEFRDREMLTEYLGRKDEMHFPKVLASMDQNEVYPHMRIAVFYDIYFGSGQMGVAVSSIDPQGLKKYMETDDSYTFYILGNGQVLYSSDLSKIGDNAISLQETFSDLTPGIHTSAHHHYEVRVSERSGFTYLAVFPELVYPAQMQSYRAGLQTLLVVLAVLSLFLCVRVSVRMYKPIETILLKFSNTASGDIRGMNELKYIINTIEQTVNDKSRVEQELEKRIELLKKAQSIALQAQINPHFMNNTLQTINSLAMLHLGAENEVSDMVNALSGMLRLSLEDTSQIIPLRQEIEHCQRYLEIQEKRYKDRFEVTWDVPETLMQYKTLKILLQPIVENCIYHAIKPLSTKGHIHIQGALEEKALLLRVQDDGLGMDAVKLSELKEILKSESIRESRHLGIANVSQRIRLYFGEEYGVTIESQPLVGTTVTVRIPQIVEPVLK